MMTLVPVNLCSVRNVDGFRGSAAKVARVATVAHILSHNVCAPSNNSKMH